jgi:hypothetical protein
MKKIGFLLILLLIINFGMIFYKDKLFHEKIEKLQEELAKKNINLEVISKEKTSWFFWNCSFLLDTRLQGNILGNNFYSKIAPIKVLENQVILPKKITLYGIFNKALQEKMSFEEKYQLDITSDINPLLLIPQERQLELIAPKLYLRIKNNNQEINLKELEFKKTYNLNSWLYFLSSKINHQDKEGKISFELKRDLGKFYGLKLHLAYENQEIMIEGGSKKEEPKKIKANFLIKDLDALLLNLKNIIKLSSQEEKLLEKFKIYEEKLLKLARQKGHYKEFNLEEKDSGLFIEKENIFDWFK